MALLAPKRWWARLKVFSWYSMSKAVVVLMHPGHQKPCACIVTPWNAQPEVMADVWLYHAKTLWYRELQKYERWIPPRRVGITAMYGLYTFSAYPATVNFLIHQAFRLLSGWFEIIMHGLFLAVLVTRV